MTGATLKRLRKRLGYTQAELAQRLKMPRRQTIVTWEGREQLPLRGVKAVHLLTKELQTLTRRK